MSEWKGLIPHLVVNGAAKAIEFYTAAPGAVELARMPTDDGRLMHAALKIGDAHVVRRHPRILWGHVARLWGRRR